MEDQEKLNEFGSASYEEWLKLVERDLKGAPFEKKLVKRIAGVDVKPLYTRGDAAPDAAGLPGFAPYTRGAHALGAAEMGWDVRELLTQASPQAAGQRALEALNGGASSLLLRLDRAQRTGSAEHGQEGIALHDLSELEQVLEHAPLDKTPIALDAGVSAFPVAAGLLALAKKRNVKPSALTGSLGVDPLGSLARAGALPGSLEAALAEAAELAKWTAEHSPRLRALAVDTTAYHEAGADAATEIAVALATGVSYLRALTEAGLSLAQAAGQLTFVFAVGRDLFLEIAKLRAARLCWSKVLATAGDGENLGMVIDARTSLRTKTQRDPWVNMLRGTGESFAAAVGGADSIATLPFDALLGESDEFGARMARNTQHLLRYESNVHRVVDPAGGSFYVESLTESLSRKAWEKFQGLEKQGGMAAVLGTGSLQAELARALEADRKAVATRKIALTGVNEFPHVREAAVERARPDTAEANKRAASRDQASPSALNAERLRAGSKLEQTIAALLEGASFARLRALLAAGEPARATALTCERLAQPFEALRDAADRFAAARGARPRVFLANLGPIPEHKARAGFAQNYFEAGGFETVSNDGFSDAPSAAKAFAASGAEVAVLCSSDAVYAELAADTARALKAQGAKAIALAGNPGENEAAYREAGVTDFVFMGVDAVESLRSLLERVGAV